MVTVVAKDHSGAGEVEYGYPCTYCRVGAIPMADYGRVRLQNGLLSGFGGGFRSHSCRGGRNRTRGV